MSTKPTILPLWATNPVAGGVVTPSAAKQQRGWVPGERPPAQYMNWILVNTYLWLKWISDGDVSWNTMTVAHNATIGTNALDTLTINSTVSFANAVTLASIVVNAGASFNGNVTLGDAGGDALTVNATSTFQAAAAFNNSVTIAGNFTANGAASFTGNVAIGDAGTDTLTVLAATSFTGTVGMSGAVSISGASTFTGAMTWNANATLSAGKTITVSNGAASIKGMSTTRTFALIPSMWEATAGTVSNQGGFGSTLSASFTGWVPIQNVGTHETITSIVMYNTGSAPNVSSIQLWCSNPGSGGNPTQVTGIAFTAGGVTDTTWTMTGTPSIALTPSVARVFYLVVTTSAGGTTLFNSVAVGVTT